ncbi:MAG: hypothetical protein WD382_06455 [Halofilum sp. (in: g-proteobacteria)]
MHRRQGGAALLILLLMLSVGLAGMLLSARDSAEKQRAAGTVEDAVVLARARDVLLARALADQNRPGSMPCAAADDEGKGTFNGDNCETSFGRFPHHTLEIVPLRTRDGDPLLYVMDKGLRDRSNAEPINPQAKPGSLTFNGEDGYAAVLLAPGPPLPGQIRDADADMSDYLEDGNEQGPAFKDCWPGDDCNDRAIGIKTDELFHRVQQRVVQRVADELREFYSHSGEASGDRYLPYAADFGSRECEEQRNLGQLAFEDQDDDCLDDDAEVLDIADFEYSEGNNWIDANDWFDLIVYHVDPQCSRTEQECDDVTFEVDGEQVHAVVAASGRALEDQSRPGDSVSDYLDHPDNRDGGSNYVTRPLGTEHNDVVLGIDVFEEPS